MLNPSKSREGAFVKFFRQSKKPQQKEKKMKKVIQFYAAAILNNT